MSVTTSEELRVARDVQTYKYTAVATMTLLVYDHILTSDDGFNLVWRSKLSLVKVTLFLCQLMVFTPLILELIMLFGNLPSQICKNLLAIIIISIICVFSLTELLLIARVYAIWQRSKPILVFSLGLLTAGLVGALYLTLRSFQSKLETPVLYASHCIMITSTDSGHRDWMTYLQVVVLDSAFLLLIFLRVVSFRENGNFNLSTILRFVVKDGIIYFIGVLVVATGFIVLTTINTDHFLKYLTVTLSATLQYIFCSRMLLRLRMRYSTPHVCTESSISTLSRIRFPGETSSTDRDLAPVNEITVTEA